MIVGNGILGVDFSWAGLLGVYEKKWASYLAVAVGLLASVLSGSLVGLVSLMMVLWVVSLNLVGQVVHNRWWVFALMGVVFNLVSDKLTGQSWSIWEGIINFVILAIALNMSSTKSELRLRV